MRTDIQMQSEKIGIETEMCRVRRLENRKSDREK